MRIRRSIFISSEPISRKTALVYEEPEHPRRGIYAATTIDERFLLLYMTEGATNDNSLKVRNLAAGSSSFTDIISTFDHSYNVIGNIDDQLLILTNDGASRKRLISIDANNPDPDNWKVIIPEKEEVLNGVSYVGGKLNARYLKDASSKVYVYSVEGEEMGEVELPGIGTVSGMSGKKDETTAFYTFTSFHISFHHLQIRHRERQIRNLPQVGH